MPKHIRYRAKVVGVGDSQMIEVVILEQSHRCREFGAGRMEFRARDLQLCSYCYPEVFVYSGAVSLRGDAPHKDDYPILMTTPFYQRFKKAVLEYNETFKN